MEVPQSKFKLSLGTKRYMSKTNSVTSNQSLGAKQISGQDFFWSSKMLDQEIIPVWYVLS